MQQDAEIIESPAVWASWFQLIRRTGHQSTRWPISSRGHTRTWQQHSHLHPCLASVQPSQSNFPAVLTCFRDRERERERERQRERERERVRERERERKRDNTSLRVDVHVHTDIYI